ncbi:MAG: hypothetical protein Q4B96_05325 [Bacillota bacterium]|nr:hypothetical protein [Bacillota bacterium]
MTYVIGAAAGLLYGGLCGWLKYFFLWQPIMKGRRAADGRHIYGAIIISMAANIVILLAVFFLRGLLPFSYEAALIAAAVALSLLGRLSPLRDARKLAQLESLRAESVAEAAPPDDHDEGSE